MLTSRRNLPAKGGERQDGSAISKGQKRQDDGNASSAKKKKQRGSDVDSTDDSSASLDLHDSDESEDDNEGTGERHSIATNLDEKTKAELVKIFEKQRKQIKDLQKKLEKAKTVQRQTKKQVQIEQHWTGIPTTLTVLASSARHSSSQGTSA